MEFWCSYATLRIGPGRARHDGDPGCRSNSNDTIGFVALAKEQLAAVTDNWFHWFLPFTKPPITGATEFDIQRGCHRRASERTDFYVWAMSAGLAVPFC